MKIYFCCDTTAGFTIPDTWTVVLYDTKDPWSFRVNTALQVIQSTYILYTKKDWLLLDHLNTHAITHLIDKMKEVKSEFLMSYPWDIDVSECIQTNYNEYILCKMPRGHLIHPAIWKKTLLENVCSKPIIFVDNEGGTRNITQPYNCLALVNTRFTNDLATRSLLFPHMHAIAKGRWSFLRHPELKAFVEAYGIDTTTRGEDTEWLVGYR